MYSWDEAKNFTNQQKHGLSFELAKLVFEDPLHLTRQDRVENGEKRWQTIGMVQGVVLILVAHTWFESSNGDEHIRIISAPRTTKHERKIYEHNN